METNRCSSSSSSSFQCSSVCNKLHLLLLSNNRHALLQCNLSNMLALANPRHQALISLLRRTVSLNNSKVPLLNQHLSRQLARLLPGHSSSTNHLIRLQGWTT
jgi:hypothetical protein